MTKNITPIEIKNMDERSRDEYFMGFALEEAHKAYALGEIPIGAILVQNNTIISRHHNRRELWRLTGCTLYVTIEPCPMCAGAIINSRIDRVVYGASDYKGGAVESLFNVLSHPGLNHEPELASGILGDECSQIMKDFFKERRKTRRSTQEAEGSALEMR
ncbi:MAG: nucleoside deaminase [Veillonella sp.]|nr:nucleoside deaminase [Veillonella sp.]